MSGEPGTCRIVMDPPVVDYGTTDLGGNFILSRNPATPVIKLNGNPVGDGQVGPITKELQEGFNRYIDTVSS